ncbi:hypothetical protein D3C80_1187210 [compost metagenome]
MPGGKILKAFDDLFDILAAFQIGNEDGVLLHHDPDVAQADGRYQDAVARTDEAALRIFQHMEADIAFARGVNSVPSAEIGPFKRDRQHGRAAGLLHDRIVDGDLGGGSEGFAQ